MTTVKSPGGSTFPYYYKGGELHALKYGSHFKEEERLFRVMDAEQAFLLRHPLLKIPIWVDFYETELSSAVIAKFAGQMKALAPHVVKLALVGCPQSGAKKILSALARLGADTMPIAFYSDPEEAKTWLVSGRS